MTIDILSAMGAFVGPESFIRKSFDWRLNDDSPVVHYEVSIKKEPTVADIEFFTVGDLASDDRSIMARRVHKLVRINKIDDKDVGSFQIPHDNVKQLQPSLLMKFIAAINEVEREVAEAGKPKPAARKKTK